MTLQLQVIELVEMLSAIKPLNEKASGCMKKDPIESSDSEEAVMLSWEIMERHAEFGVSLLEMVI